jgi:hypothetical protein
MPRNKYVGSWTEPVSERIALPFTLASAKTVLAWGAGLGEPTYTHRDIAHWCYRFCRAFAEADTDDQMTEVLDILDDVDAQWDLFLANTYPLAQLQELDLDSVQLPKPWFSQWLDRLARISH